MKVVTIIGARPQFIKAAVLSRIFKVKGVCEIIIHTGQHYDENMSNIFFKEMSIPSPNYNLNINSLGHGAMTGQMLEKIEEVLIIEKPDWVLVYGDTNSTLAGALAARKLQIKLAHVEAGLRSNNMRMPEEINRILTDRISNILFCPTDYAVENLIREGFNNFDCKIFKTGDVMYDAALFYENKSIKPPLSIASEFILVTIHRAENTDNLTKLQSIIKALDEISKDKTIILPLHPRTKSKLVGIKYSFETSKIKFIDPVGYFEMVWLLKNCDFVMTDSGGVQKEAFFFKKYCLTLREETEWLELVDNNYNFLVGSNYNSIIDAVSLLLKERSGEFNCNLYGKGDAGLNIYNELINLANETL